MERRAPEGAGGLGLTPEDRLLFERIGVPLHQSLAYGDRFISAEDVLGDEEKAAVLLLVRLGLLLKLGEDYVAVDPGAVTSNVVSPLSQRAAEMMEEASSWARSFSELSSAWRRAPKDAGAGVLELRGEAIDPAIASLVADAQSELLTAQPQAGRSVPALRAATQRDLDALERGVKMRTLYQHSARRHRTTHDYVAVVSGRGAEVRTLDEFFNRLIVIDRRVAIIPGASGTATAVIVREPNVVAYLVDVFDRTWERARPFDHGDQSLTRAVAAEQRAMTIRMLVAGHADPASAKRLGVSPRTYASYVADLKQEFDVETRFQLGWEMGRRGVSGDEDGGGA